MTKTYKHKVKGWTAELCESNPSWYRVNHYLNNYHLVHPELIEGCSDREEVVEKEIDWIDATYNEYYNKDKQVMENEYLRSDFRKVIEKHAPQVKKFTNSEIVERVWNKKSESLHQHRDLMVGTLVSFLRDKNFYSSDE